MSQKDTNNKITQLNQRQIDMVCQFEFAKKYSISEIQSLVVSESISLATLKRDLNVLIENNLVRLEGEKRGAYYVLTDFGLVRKPLFTDIYFTKDIYRKSILEKYNYSLFDILEKENIFSESELKLLEENTKIFKEKGRDNSETINKRELERFIIELSWKSSKIEGNTYTLLDTERLIREGVESESNTKDEAIMILNHKKALNYILECIKLNKNLESFRELENIHRLLVEGLGINHGLRKNAVGVTGTKYLPLDNGPQIEEEVRRFMHIITSKKENYSKALLSILCISYLQAFEDGNKRTGRLFANAMLLSAGLAPLSYRDVDEKLYREAVLIFYEQNSVEAFKKIFVEQYVFSCNTYNLG
jgi:hypothetical protein